MMIESKPLVKKIMTEQGYYLYGARSNRLFRVTKIMYESIDLLDQISEHEIIKRMSGQYSLNEIHQMLDTFNTLIKKYNFFSPGPLTQRVGEIGSEDIESQLISGPQSLTLELTEECNLRCKYCIYSGGYPSMRAHGHGKMTWPIAKAAIDFYLRLNENAERINIGFYGGEPLLQFTLIKQICEYVIGCEKLNQKHRSLLFSLTTNATLLTQDKLDFFIANDFCLTISFDGPQEFHNQNRVDRKGRGTHEIVFTKLKKIYDQDPEYYEKRILVNAVIAPPNRLFALQEFFEKYPHLFGRRMNFSSVDDGNQDYMEKNPQYPDYQLDLNAIYNEFFQSHIDENFNENQREKFSHKLLEYEFLRFFKRQILDHGFDELNRINTCIPGKRKLFVDTYGQFHICERMTRQFPIGDINLGYDIKRITYYVNEFNKVMNSYECRNCWAVQMCPICFTVGKDGKFKKEEVLKRCSSYLQTLDSILCMFCSIIEKKPGAFDYFNDYTLA